MNEKSKILLLALHTDEIMGHLVDNLKKLKGRYWAILVFIIFIAMIWLIGSISFDETFYFMDSLMMRLSILSIGGILFAFCFVFALISDDL